MTLLIQTVETSPTSKVAIPVKVKLITMVCFGPKRSDTQPPRTPQDRSIGPGEGNHRVGPAQIDPPLAHKIERKHGINTDRGAHAQAKQHGHDPE